MTFSQSDFSTLISGLLLAFTINFVSVNWYRYPKGKSWALLADYGWWRAIIWTTVLTLEGASYFLYFRNPLVKNDYFLAIAVLAILAKVFQIKWAKMQFGTQHRNVSYPTWAAACAFISFGLYLTITVLMGISNTDRTGDDWPLDTLLAFIFSIVACVAALAYLVYAFIYFRGGSRMYSDEGTVGPAAMQMSVGASQPLVGMRRVKRSVNTSRL